MELMTFVHNAKLILCHLKVIVWLTITVGHSVQRMTTEENAQWIIREVGGMEAVIILI